MHCIVVFSHKIEREFYEWEMWANHNGSGRLNEFLGHQIVHSAANGVEVGREGERESWNFANDMGKR